MVKIRRQHNDELHNILSKMNSSLQLQLQSINQSHMQLLRIAACIHRLEIDFNGHCDFMKLASILRQCPILERIRIRVKYYPKNLDLISLRQLSPYFATLTFGDIQKETGKPVIIAKWPS